MQSQVRRDVLKTKESGPHEVPHKLKAQIAATAAFLLALASGHTLGEAAQDALDACEEFNLTDSLAGLIRHGLAERIII